MIYTTELLIHPTRKLFRQTGSGACEVVKRGSSIPKSVREFFAFEIAGGAEITSSGTSERGMQVFVMVHKIQSPQLHCFYRGLARVTSTKSGRPVVEEARVRSGHTGKFHFRYRRGKYLTCDS